MTVVWDGDDMSRLILSFRLMTFAWKTVQTAHIRNWAEVAVIRADVTTNGEAQIWWCWICRYVSVFLGLCIFRMGRISQEETDAQGEKSPQLEDRVADANGKLFVARLAETVDVTMFATNGTLSEGDSVHVAHSVKSQYLCPPPCTVAVNDEVF